MENGTRRAIEEVVHFRSSKNLTIRKASSLYAARFYTPRRKPIEGSYPTIVEKKGLVSTKREYFTAIIVRIVIVEL